MSARFIDAVESARTDLEVLQNEWMEDFIPGEHQCTKVAKHQLPSTKYQPEWDH